MEAARSLSSIRRSLERRFDLAVRRYPIEGSRAAELRAVIGGMRLDGVVDVGGHEGGFTRFLRQDVGYKGHVVSFEPFPGAFEKLLEASSDDPSWHVHNSAVGSEQGAAEFFIYSNSFFNSFHRINALGCKRFSQVQPVSSIVSAVGRLDQLYESSWGSRLFLKSDTQGNDLGVIDGADGIMDLIYGVQLEAGIVPIYDDAPSLSDSVDRLASLGFGACSFHPVSRHKNSRAVMEFDVVFVRL